MDKINNDVYFMSLAVGDIRDAMENLDMAQNAIMCAFDGNEPDHPTADNINAEAWDYLDAIDIAKRALGYRLNTWDNGDYDE